MKKYCLSQELLLKSCFLDNGEVYFRRWLSLFNESDLDYYTRAVIPVLLGAVDVAKINSDLYQKMGAYKRQNWIANNLKLQKIKPVLVAFYQAGIDFCFLKGIAMTLFYYHDISQRPENADIDILIDQVHLPLAIKILKKLGYVSQNIFLWDANRIEDDILNDGSVMAHLHAVHYAKENIVIDLHWNLSPILKNMGYSKLKKYLYSRHLFGMTCYFLCPEMQLVHLGVHAFLQDGKSRSINSLIDFGYLIRHEGMRLDLLDTCISEFCLKPVFIKTLIDFKVFVSVREYERYFHINKGSYLKLFFLRKRIFQVWYFLSLSRFNPLNFFHAIKNYFGAKRYSELFLYILKKNKVVKC